MWQETLGLRWDSHCQNKQGGISAVSGLSTQEDDGNCLVGDLILLRIEDGRHRCLITLGSGDHRLLLLASLQAQGHMS